MPLNFRTTRGGFSRGLFRPMQKVRLARLDFPYLQPSLAAHQNTCYGCGTTNTSTPLAAPFS